jgi:hypothetical protein
MTERTVTGDTFPPMRQFSTQGPPCNITNTAKRPREAGGGQAINKLESLR